MNCRFENAGREMHDWLRQLFPYCRSITGEIVRQSLRFLQTHLPIQTTEIPSGTQVFDWVVPKEWSIRDAWIKDEHGNTIIDFKNHNLHVVSYSRPVKTRLSFDKLRPHLFTSPKLPDAIPYRTTYYQDDWGFCMSHRQFESLQDCDYDVYIDSELISGSMTLGELVVPGESENEVLISAHICHPSLANDNLSGVVVAARLATEILKRPTRQYSYRFLWMPGTIGAIAWLATHEHLAPRIRHGLVLSGVGDQGQFHYKQSRRGNAQIDKTVAYVLREMGYRDNILPFSPYGYDERQYCSPGFNLPVGCFSRSCYGTYPQYHTSLDTIDFVKPDSLGESLEAVLQVIDIIEGNYIPINLLPKCEPQLGKRGLYEQLKEDIDRSAMLWLLNQADGSQTLLEIAEKSGIPFSKMQFAGRMLAQNQLIEKRPIDPEPAPT